MRILALIPLALLAAAAPPQSPARQSPAPEAPPSLDRMNAFVQRPGCASITRQVAGEDRRYNGTRLDQQPPARLILAVDRHMDGCHEVVFASERRYGPGR
jgi:hypothetical protein